MLAFQLWCLWLASSFVACLADGSEVTFNIGIIGPFTSGIAHPLAAAVAFDLDLRKNHDEDIRNRFGPPIVNISGLDSRLRLRPYIGTTHASPAIGVRTALDWFLGSENSSTLVGVVGGMYSSVSIPISSNAAVFKVPMISFASTSPALSDKAEHPYFSRTVSPDTLMATAHWAWTDFFSMPSVAYVYAKEPYGEGLFGAFFNLALLAGQTYRVHGVGVEYDPSGFQLEPCEDALRILQSSGRRFAVVVLASLQFNSFMYVLEREHNFHAYQWLLAEAMYLIPSHPYTLTNESLVGMHSFDPASRGAKFPEFQDMWSKLSVQDLYGSAARERYRLDHMQVPLLAEDQLTAQDFDDVASIDFLSSFLFDAGYAFVFALNSLLVNGTDPADIKGARLLEEVRRVSFEGVSGPVSFNAAGDRLVSFSLLNEVEHGKIQIGSFDSLAGELSLQADPLWMDGTQSRFPPSFLYECFQGFEKDRQTSVCEPCRKGIACGYQPEVGFPLGILGPMTSVSQAYLAAAALFDLDFRKNFEPELQERFGPPIFNITNLDARLRFKVQIATSNSQPEVGVNSALDWLQGNGDFYRVVGIVGGFHSALSTPVSSLASVFEVPMVSWASSSPTLSDKNTHPYFSRTAPSDTVQGSAIWAWMKHFGVPSAAFLYTMEPYGAGLYSFVNDIAIAQGAASRIQGIAVVHQPSSYDLLVARDACDRIRDTGSKFIILAMSAMEATAAMHVMELEGMLYEGFQLFGSESVSYLAHAEIRPSRGLPVGLQQFQPVSRGSLYPAFLEMYRQLTVDDIYGTEAVARYMLDAMQVPLEDAAAPSLEPTDFQTPEDGLDIWASFLLDAAYTYVHAINNLLLAGTEPTEIYGSVLLEEIRRTQFEGVSGLVEYDENGDRPSKFELWNVQIASSSNTTDNATSESNASFGSPILGELVAVGFYDASTQSLVFLEDASIYWAGGVESDTVPEDLLSCNPGFEWDAISGACSACPLGWFSAGGRDACEACPAGATMSGQGTAAQSCTPCLPGKFSAYGDANCTSCAPGSFTAVAGRSACDSCAVGSYGAEEGLTACVACVGQRTTTMVRVEVNGVIEYSFTAGATSNSTCGCESGARPDAAGTCVGCGEGLICKGLDGVSIRQGFYSPSDLSVYRCYGNEKRCIGGVPGATCAQGRRGIACADCQDGMRPGDGGLCVDCEGADFINIILVGLLVVSLLVLTYLVIDRQNRAAQSTGLVLCAIAGGQLITATQTLGVVNRMAFELKAPFDSVLNLLSSITFDIGVLHISCMGAADPVAVYSAKIAMIFLALAGIVVVHGFFVALLHGCAFKARMPTLYGCIGTVCMVFYISVTSAVLEPLQCLQHPNDKWSMRAHPGVLCWETEEHSKMVVLGILAFVAVPVAVSVAITAIVLQYPSRMNSGDLNFLKSFSFLFFRYHPKKYWFVLVQFLRSLLVALILLIPEVTIQVVILQGIILACLLLTLHAMPWRGAHSNLLDCLCGSMMLMTVCIVSLFIEEKDRQSQLMAFLGATVVVTIVVGVFVGLAYGMYWRFGPRRKSYQFFLCHHKAGAGAFARLLKIVLVDTRKLKADVFIDSDNLENLDDLFAFVCSDTSTLVVLASSAIFTRPWCVGEMCTARLSSVQTLVVTMLDCQLPDDQFIDQLPDRVSNMELLTESGMDLEMLKETMRWVGSLPQFPLPQSMSIPVLDKFARGIISGEHQRLDPTSKSNASIGVVDAAAVILYDVESTEATASSLVLLKMLTRSMVAGSKYLPSLLDAPEDFPTATERCVVMCTAACLDRRGFLEVLLQIEALSGQVGLLPVLAEALFRVPAPAQLQGWMEQPPATGFSSEEATRLVEVVRKLFKGIATTYQPHHESEAVLMVGARQIGRQLQATLLSHASHTTQRLDPATSTRDLAVKLEEDQKDAADWTSDDIAKAEWTMLSI